MKQFKKLSEVGKTDFKKQFATKAEFEAWVDRHMAEHKEKELLFKDVVPVEYYLRFSEYDGAQWAEDVYLVISVGDFLMRPIKTAWNKKTYAFCAFGDAYFGRARNMDIESIILNKFKSDGKCAPNEVGTPTVKKLQGWADYLRDFTEACKAFESQGNTKRDEFLATLPEGEITWNEQGKRGYIQRGAFKFAFTIYEGGDVYTEITIEKWAYKKRVPKTIADFELLTNAWGNPDDPEVDM